MVLHDNPAATVVELISIPGGLSNAAMSKLPTSVILPGRIRYAIANNTREGGKNDADTSGTSFLLLAKMILHCSPTTTKLPPICWSFRTRSKMQAALNV